MTDEAPAPARFAAALTRWREQRRMTKQALAAGMGFDRSYISHIESGRHRASADLARKAEQVLSAGGELWAAWQADSAAEPSSVATSRGALGLVVEVDHAELHYDGHAYTALMRRTIVNTGPDPVTRYLVRISADRHPGDPEASNRLYRQHPLTLGDLGLTATCDGEPMLLEVKADRDSFKEIWLRFRNGNGRFPLYAGQRATLEYSYKVSDLQWGQWFQRAVRHHTLALSVRLGFPAELDATVWGTETSTTAETTPLRTPLTRREDDALDVYTWSTSDPPLNARYRLEWRFRSRDGRQDQALELRLASDRMKAAGIVQDGARILAETAAPFDLPAEAEVARELIDELLAAMVRVREHHVFGKGMGLAAPQVGVPRAAAIVQPPGDDTDPLVLLNPRVVGESGGTDEQYEGCLSFFDVRGMVPRSRRLEVEHTALDGATTVTVFTDGLARLVGHEVDHLYGRLYTARMRPGVVPISLAEYKGTGSAWSYPT